MDEAVDIGDETLKGRSATSSFHACHVNDKFVILRMSRDQYGGSLLPDLSPDAIKCTSYRIFLPAKTRRYESVAGPLFVGEVLGTMCDVFRQFPRI